jgi:predicted nucleic acid-binding protein
MIPEAFWDASVIVPLCTDQPPYTEIARPLLRRYAIAAWWGTPIEVTSALTRLKRLGALADAEYPNAKAGWNWILADSLVIQPSTSIKISSMEILEKYSLRAGDALQLAAALEWCEGEPSGQVFLTTDRRLAEAADLAGFTLEPGLI